MCNMTDLRAAMQNTLSPYRYRHTLGVEREVTALAALYCKEHTELLRAAALLHDCTKELSPDTQQEIFRAHGVTLRADEAASPKIWHGMTAALEIPVRYPTFASPALLAAVRWHSTGHAHMTLTEALLYLADYIEEGRTFPDCVALRRMFWDARPQEMSREQRHAHLVRVLLHSLEGTRRELEAEGAPVCRDSLEAEQWLKTENHPFERNVYGEF